jgi:hypothetical protein
MSHLSLNLNAQHTDERQREMKAVWIFTLVTLVLSVGILFLLPGVSGPALIVFIPVILAVVLTRYTAGKGQIRPRMFSRQRWAISLKWLVVSL